MLASCLFLFLWLFVKFLCVFVLHPAAPWSTVAPGIKIDCKENKDGGGNALPMWLGSMQIGQSCDPCHLSGSQSCSNSLGNQRCCSPLERGVLQTSRLQIARPFRFQLPQRQYQSCGPKPRSRGSLHRPPLPLQKPRQRQLWLLHTRHLQSPACHSLPGTQASSLSAPGTSTAADPRGFFLGCSDCWDCWDRKDCDDCTDGCLGMDLG